MTRVLCAAVIACCGIGCQNLSYSQRWGVQAVAFDSTLRLVVQNHRNLTDEQLRLTGVTADAVKAYLDDAYANLTDNDPSNDSLVDPMLDAVENELLPRLVALSKEGA